MNSTSIKQQRNRVLIQSFLSRQRGFLQPNTIIDNLSSITGKRMSHPICGTSNAFELHKAQPSSQVSNIIVHVSQS